MGRFITAGGGGGGGTVTPPLAFGIGLTQTGLIVDLDPAQIAPGEIGGFNEAPADGLLYARVNSAGVATWAAVTPGGLPFMGANPPPPVPPATQVIAGTLWWRTTNGSLYVYFFDGLNYQWVTASPTGEVVGAPLIFPPAPVVGAVLAATNNVTYTFDGLAWNAEDIGGGPVHIGPLPPVLVAPAVTYEPGTLWWRNDPDGVLFVWYDDGTSSQWVPATPVPESVTNPAGNDPSQIGIVWVPPRSATQGLELLDGYLTAPLATPDMPGVINEPTVGDVEHVRVRDIATGQGKWVTATTGGGIGDVPPDPVQAWARANGRWVDIPFPEAMRGLTYSRTDQNHYYSLDVATGIDLGGVFVPGGQGLNLSLSGGLELAPASQSVIGGITEAPFDSKVYARQDAHWVEVEAAGGGIGDVPPNPVQAWARASGRWVDVPIPDAGRGLTLTTNDSGINSYSLDVATGIDLGGVFVPFNQGLELTQVGELSLAPARPDMLGGLLDAPGDDQTKVYGRRWGQWIEVVGGGGIGDVPPDPVQAWARASGRWVDIPIPDAGRGLTLTRTDENQYYSLDVATGIDLGGVFVPFNVGLELTQVGGLSLAPATPDVIGGLLDAPRDDTGLKAYARKWGQWVETIAGFEDAPADGLAYWRRGTPGSVCEWQSGSLYVDNNFLPLRGGILTGRLTLPLLLPNPIQPGPPLPYPERDDDAVHKRYVDERITPGVFTGIDPPPTPIDGQLWWDESSAGLYLYYVDPTSSQWIQVNSIAGLSVTDVVTDAPADNAVYGRYNQQWEHVDVYGDMKYGFQGSDHRGWVLLDGRGVSALSSTQQLQATALGFTTNLPNAVGVVPMMGGVPGTINGTMLKTLTQANLPNVTLSAGSAGAHTHRSHGGITGSALQFEDMGGASAYENWGGYASIGDSGNNYMTWQTLVETAGAHLHDVSLGGTDTPIDVTPMNMSVNAFVFLGY